jgi:hypothetical protein
MGKVILPKEVAKAIEHVWTLSGSGGNSVKHMVLTNWNFICSNHGDEYFTLANFAKHSPLRYMHALVDGYEVEKTPEELVRLYFQNQVISLSKDEDRSVVAIQKTLNLLGIKIEGVNA